MIFDELNENIPERFCVENSPEMQEFLFELGYHWDFCETQKVKYTDCPFISVWKNGTLAHSADKNNFSRVYSLEDLQEIVKNRIKEKIGLDTSFYIESTKESVEFLKRLGFIFSSLLEKDYQMATSIWFSCNDIHYNDYDFGSGSSNGISLEKFKRDYVFCEGKTKPMKLKNKPEKYILSELSNKNWGTILVKNCSGLEEILLSLGYEWTDNGGENPEWIGRGKIDGYLWVWDNGNIVYVKEICDEDKRQYEETSLSTLKEFIHEKIRSYIQKTGKSTRYNSSLSIILKKEEGVVDFFENIGFRISDNAKLLGNNLWIPVNDAFFTFPSVGGTSTKWRMTFEEFIYDLHTFTEKKKEEKMTETNDKVKFYWETKKDMELYNKYMEWNETNDILKPSAFFALVYHKKENRAFCEVDRRFTKEQAIADGYKHISEYSPKDFAPLKEKKKKFGSIELEIVPGGIKVHVENGDFVKNETLEELNRLNKYGKVELTIGCQTFNVKEISEWKEKNED